VERALHAALPAARAPRHSGDPVDLRALADLPLARSRQEDNPGVFDLITVACEAAGIDPPSGPTLGSVQDLLVAHVAAARCWTLLYASTPDAVVPHNVVLTATRPAMHVTTALAVPANPRRPLLDDLLTAAGLGGEG
jgi:hypothetical protein